MIVRLLPLRIFLSYFIPLPKTALARSFPELPHSEIIKWSFEPTMIKDPRIFKNNLFITWFYDASNILIKGYIFFMNGIKYRKLHFLNDIFKIIINYNGTRTEPLFSRRFLYELRCKTVFAYAMEAVFEKDPPGLKHT
jgi:hypothetical protein